MFSDTTKLHIPHLGHEGQPAKTGEIVRKSSTWFYLIINNSTWWLTNRNLLLFSSIMVLFGRGRQMPRWVDQQEHDLQEIGDTPPPWLCLALLRPPLEHSALSAELSPCRCLRQVRPWGPSARACGFWGGWPAWFSWWGVMFRCNGGEEQPPNPWKCHPYSWQAQGVVGVNCRSSGWVLRQFSLVRRGGCPWRQWFGTKGLQSQAGQRYLWTVTGVIDSPLVVSPGDHLKSLPTFFFNGLYEIQYFGICIWITPELVHSITHSLPSSFLLLVHWWAPREGLAMLWALRAPLFALWLELSKLHVDASLTVGMRPEHVGWRPKERGWCAARCWGDLANACHPIQESTAGTAATGLVPSQHQPPAWASLQLSRE